MSTLQLKNDLLKYIINIEDKSLLLQLWTIVKAEPQKKPKNLSKYIGTINTGLTVEQIDEQLNSIRNEWERDIY